MNGNGAVFKIIFKICITVAVKVLIVLFIIIYCYLWSIFQGQSLKTPIKDVRYLKNNDDILFLSDIFIKREKSML